MIKAPERIHLDGDSEAGGGMFPRCFENPKYCSEPAIEYIRADLGAVCHGRGIGGPLVWAAGAGWHPGVVGIVAARLKEATGRSAVVIGLEGSIGKGSARAADGA